MQLASRRYIMMRVIEISVLVAASSLLILPNFCNGQVSPVNCGNTNCSTNICRTTSRSCCWCERVDYAPLQVCECCPLGSYCCNPNVPPGASLSRCCPTGTLCSKQGCTGVIRALPSSTVCGLCDHMYLSITADNAVDSLYLDGVLYSLPHYNDWTVVDTISIPADTQVIATQCSDQGVVGGLLASVTNDYVLTDAQWKCTNNTPATKWYDPAFNDAGWPQAVVAGVNNGSDSYHGSLGQISSNAQWIWTHDYTVSPVQTPVYCRGYFTKDPCNVNFGNCSDLCKQQDKVCCQCELMQTGPSKVCSCCPQGYYCCKPSPIGPPNRPRTCCPLDYSCSLDGLSCTAKFIVKPQPAVVDCGPCN